MIIPQEAASHKILCFVDAYGDSIYKFCRSLTYSREDAEDLCQETFLRALEQSEKIMTCDHPRSFFFSITISTWKSWKRKYARRKRIAAVEPLEKAVEEGISGGVNIEEHYIMQEENRLVRQVVEALPEKYKIPIYLYYSQEMSVTDVAFVLKLPAGTVKSRLFKGRKLVEKGLGVRRYEK